jgi:hypothetical protein
VAKRVPGCTRVSVVQCNWPLEPTRLNLVSDWRVHALVGGSFPRPILSTACGRTTLPEIRRVSETRRRACPLTTAGWPPTTNENVPRPPVGRFAFVVYGTNDTIHVCVCLGVCLLFGWVL